MARATIASLQETINQQKGQITVLRREKKQIQRQADPLLAQIKNHAQRNERLLQDVDELKKKHNEQAQTIASQDEDLKKSTSINGNLERRLANAERQVSEQVKKLQALEKQAMDIFRGHLAICNLVSAGNP